jgi:hypothetical protein
MNAYAIRRARVLPPCTMVADHTLHSLPLGSQSYHMLTNAVHAIAHAIAMQRRPRSRIATSVRPIT